MAENGQLVCVTAGKKESCDKAVPYTTGVMGRANIDYSGQPAGNATLLKVIGNTFILNMVSQLSEGHVLAEKSGLGQFNPTPPSPFPALNLLTIAQAWTTCTHSSQRCFQGPTQLTLNVC
jgi:hypothetical protein